MGNAPSSDVFEEWMQDMYNWGKFNSISYCNPNTQTQVREIALFKMCEDLNDRLKAIEGHSSSDLRSCRTETGKDL